MITNLMGLIVALMLAMGTGHDDRKMRVAQCKKTKEQIKQVQSKLRSGYTRAQGEKLEARLRDLRKKRKRYC